MNKDIYDILESSLQDLENGIGIEDILARFPDHAKELRPILNAALQAKHKAAPAPAPAVMARSRARLMQKTTELQQGKRAPRKHAIPLFQRMAISFTVTATLLLSGTSLVSASSTALPGQNLYPVKRSWENIQLFFTFNEEKRSILEMEFEGERLDEIHELFADDSDDDRRMVDFSGLLTIANGVPYISKVQVLFPTGVQIPPQGTALHITGWTTEKDYVEIVSYEILPPGTKILDGVTTPFPSLEDGNGSDDHGGDVHESEGGDDGEHESDHEDD